MTIKVAFTVDDADLEAGLAQAIAADNAVSGRNETVEEFTNAIALRSLEAFRGSAKRAFQAKVEKLDFADLAEFLPAIEAKLGAKHDESISPGVIATP